MVLEVRVNVTVTVEESGRLSPSSRVRVGAGQVGRNIAVGEEEDLDEVIGPFHGVDTAVVAVESVTVRGSVSRVNTTAGVFALASGLGVAVAGGNLTTEARVVDAAAIRSVQGHGIAALLVDTLDDIDLSVVGPVGADGPESRPGATDGAGHVGKVKNEQALVVGGSRGQTDTLATTSRGSVGVVNTNVGAVTLGSDQTGTGGSVLVDVGDISGGRVGVLVAVRMRFSNMHRYSKTYSEEAELGEEVHASRVVVQQGVGTIAAGLTVVESTMSVATAELSQSRQLNKS